MGLPVLVLGEAESGRSDRDGQSACDQPADEFELRYQHFDPALRYSGPWPLTPAERS
jgi:hypothetical protein